ncbi:MAG: hypothetical protein WD042_16630 [Phycisphaeraceae bacterium]
MLVRQIKHWLMPLTILALLLAAAVLTARAEEPAKDQAKPAAASPAPAPELPAGHPPIGGGAAGPAGTGDGAALPPGHPPMPGGQAELPPGHPSMPNANPDMPAGHPPMAGPAKLKDEPFLANLAIKVSHGTAGGKLPQNMVAKIKFVAGDKVIKETEAQIDSHGVSILADVQLPGPAQPYVTVQHGDLKFLAVGKAMGSTAADQMLRLTIYDAAAEAPQWSVTMRHVMVRRDARGLFVTEVLVLNCPGDRVWVGQPLDQIVKDAAAARKTAADSRGTATLVLPLPVGATEARAVTGLNPDATIIDSGRLISTDPLMPGTAKIQIAYLVPIRKGIAVLDITAPAAVKATMVMVPDDGTVVHAMGLEQGETAQGGKTPIRLYHAADQAAQSKISLTISGLESAARASAGQGAGQAAAGTVPVQPEKRSSAKLIAGLGAGALVTAAVAVMLIKAPVKKVESKK